MNLNRISLACTTSDMMVSVRMNTYMPVCPLVVIIDLSSLLGLGLSQMDTSLDQSFENIITEFYEV
jgi:hypothetical protein